MLMESSREPLRPREPLRVAVGVILRRKQRVLMGLRAGGRGDGTWGFPGGGVEADEDPLAAAVQELREETGLEAQDLEPATWTVVSHPDGSNWLVVFVYAQAHGEPTRIEPRKCLEWRWVRWDALPEPLFHGPQRLVDRGWCPATTAARA